MQAEELLRDGRLTECLQQAQDAVRNDPANAPMRIFLFQLLSVLGEWDRAMTQLNVAAEMDADAMLMAQVCRPALNAEALRAEIFAGNRLPHIFGEPAEWVARVVQAVQLGGDGHFTDAVKTRNSAFDDAAAIGGTVNDQPFEWIADADPRLGPMLEAIIEGRYCWVPFEAVREITFEAPVDLRDVVWIPARFVWINGGEVVGLMPVRYPGSESSDDAGIQLARKTIWEQRAPDFPTGLGQRVLATDRDEYPLLECRHIVLNNTEAVLPEPSIASGGANDG